METRDVAQAKRNRLSERERLAAFADVSPRARFFCIKSRRRTPRVADRNCRFNASSKALSRSLRAGDGLDQVVLPMIALRPLSALSPP